MITLVILQSNSAHADKEKTIESCKEIVGPIEYAGVPLDINNLELNTNWILVLYDDEVLESELAEAIPIFIESNLYDGLILLKKVTETTKIYRCVRVFKCPVTFTEEGLIPIEQNEMELETVLNGWVLDCAEC